MASAVLTLGSDRQQEATRVLADAFHEYPVMRCILDANHPHYDSRVERFIGFSVASWFLRDDPVLGVAADNGQLIAVATIGRPGHRPEPPELAGLREAMWVALGPEARRRYDAYEAAWHSHELAEPHYHLSLLGVLHTHRGTGPARALLDAVHAMSRETPDSVGVTLNTEDPRNVRLYEHYGYQVRRKVQVFPGDDTWSMFRPDDGT